MMINKERVSELRDTLVPDQKKIRGIASPLLASSSDFFFINIYLTPPPAPNYIYFRNIREGGEKTIYIYIYIYIDCPPTPSKKIDYIIFNITTTTNNNNGTTYCEQQNTIILQSYYNHITIIFIFILYLYYIYI
jgi:hypothetical protein